MINFRKVIDDFFQHNSDTLDSLVRNSWDYASLVSWGVTFADEMKLLGAPDTYIREQLLSSYLRCLPYTVDINAKRYAAHVYQRNSPSLCKKIDLCSEKFITPYIKYWFESFKFDKYLEDIDETKRIEEAKRILHECADVYTYNSFDTIYYAYKDTKTAMKLTRYFSKFVDQLSPSERCTMLERISKKVFVSFMGESFCISGAYFLNSGSSWGIQLSFIWSGEDDDNTDNCEVGMYLY